MHLVLLASPALRMAPSVDVQAHRQVSPVMGMQEELLNAVAGITESSGVAEESCTMGGGRVTGTLIRQSNGVIVPTNDEMPSPVLATTMNERRVAVAESSPLGGGRVTGTLIRQSNGMIVPKNDESFSSPVERPVSISRSAVAEACTMGGGRVSGSLVRQSNGFVVPTNDEPSLPMLATTKNDALGILNEACTLGGGRVSGTPVGYAGGSAATPSSYAFAPPTGARARAVDRGVVVPTIPPATRGADAAAAKVEALAA